jgi:hypothetical protein
VSSSTYAYIIFSEIVVNVVDAELGSGLGFVGASRVSISNSHEAAGRHTSNLQLESGALGHRVRHDSFRRRDEVLRELRTVRGHMSTENEQ